MEEFIYRLIRISFGEFWENQYSVAGEREDLIRAFLDLNASDDSLFKPQCVVVSTTTHFNSIPQYRCPL
jgi:hypothetical protein